MSDVFISYKREEQPEARKLADTLEALGWSVWWDPKLRAGERFDDVIEQALTEAKCVIVLWSHRSVKSEYVKAEAHYALDKKKLVPVAIDPDLQPSFRFRRLHTVKLVNWDTSRESSDFRELVEDIAAILGAPPIQAELANRRAEEDKRRRTEEEAKPNAEEKQRRRQQEEAKHKAEVAKAPPSRAPWVSAPAIIASVLLIGGLYLWSTSQQREAERIPQEREAQQREAERIAQEEESKRLTSDKVFRDTLKDGSDGPEMVRIKGGTFQMGSPKGEADRDDNERLHEVRVKDFAIGNYAVTFEEYDTFAEATDRKKPSDAGWGRERRPVINVRWKDAVAYAEWLSEQTGKRYRLPTEAEWEYAARAGTETPYWWGDSIGNDRANCKGCGSQWDNKKTAPVDAFAPNSSGLYQMLGNVWEWTCSAYDGDYDGSELKCVDKGSFRRVIRGGSWSFDPWYLRSANRDWYFPNGWNYDIGFRLAQDIE